MEPTTVPAFPDVAELHQRMINLTNHLTTLQYDISTLQMTVDQLEFAQMVDIGNLNHAWLLLSTFLVFFMQTGFMILETGGVSRKVLYESIILKNMINSSIAAIVFYLIGYGFAFGTGGTASRFIGANYFALSNSPPLHNFFWQWSFLSTCATIPSGAMAERTRLRSHCYWVVLASFIVYPLCAHWLWSADGWLSPQLPEDQLLFANGVLDFAGSGVVHLLGGTAGLVGAIVAGKRVGRFEDIYERKMLFLPQNIGEMALGTFILWFSWYGFNCGSTVILDNGRAAVASKAAVTTTISASAAGIVALLIVKFKTGKWSLITFLNGVLSGLVAITGGCAYVEPWAAIAIGCVSGAIYNWTSIIQRYFEIDDVIEVGPVHVANGFWGLLAVGLFATKENIFILHGRNTHAGLLVGGGALQFAIQLLAAVIIVLWSLFWSFGLFWFLRYMNQLRIDAEWEKKALEEDVVQMEVKSTLQLMAHNYDMDNRYVRNVDTDNTSILAADPPAYPGGAGGIPAAMGTGSIVGAALQGIDSQNDNRSVHSRRSVAPVEGSSPRILVPMRRRSSAAGNERSVHRSEFVDPNMQIQPEGVYKRKSNNRRSEYVDPNMQIQTEMVPYKRKSNNYEEGNKNHKPSREKRIKKVSQTVNSQIVPPETNRASMDTEDTPVDHSKKNNSNTSASSNRSSSSDSSSTSSD